MGLLTKVTTKPRMKPMGIIVHSRGGLGKTTFLADAVRLYSDDSILFQCCEDGLADLSIPDVRHYEEVLGMNDNKAQAWIDFKECIVKPLLIEDHGFKLVAFDNLDDLINQCLDPYIVKTYYKDDIKEANAWGGSKIKEMYAEFAKIIHAFKMLQSKGTAILIAVHSQPTRFKDPSAEDYKKWCFNVPSRDDYSLRELLFNWSSATMFGTIDVSIGKDGKVRGKRHVLHTKQDASYDAKCRYHIPEVIDFNFQAFANAIKQAKES